MRKKLIVILLCTTPIYFFWGNRLIQYIFGRNNPESLKSEIIGAVFVGYTTSCSAYFIFRKQIKEEK